MTRSLIWIVVLANYLNTKKSRKKRTHVLDFFPRHYFWEFYADSIYFEDSPQLVIERVLNRTPADKIKNAIRKLEIFYPKNMIKTIAKSSSQIFGNENIEAIAKYYSISPKLFPRYIC